MDGGTVALAKVAAVNFTLTGPPGGPVGRAGQLLVTGGAVAPRRERTRTAHLHRCLRLAARPGPTCPRRWPAAPTRIPLPDSPQGEAISFAADNRNLVVASEGLPSDLTVVPLAAETVAAIDPAPAGPRAEPDGLHQLRALADHQRDSSRPPSATVVVWIGGKLRRQPEPIAAAARPPRAASRGGGEPVAQTRRRTLTTRPRTVASSPGIGS